ncbi:hypothetical protein D3C86_2208060 [compost metagenome]
MFTQVPDHLAADNTVVQVKVRQDQFRCPPLQGQQGPGLVGGDHHFAAPLPEQRAHAFENAHFVVDHQ